MVHDAALFAEWDVDYVKLDGCYSNHKDMDEGNCIICLFNINL
jgi:hypothetical protein